MMTGKNRRVHIDHDSPEPVYRQLAEIIRGRIERREYAPGQPVPSIERIRQETGLSVMTIRKGIRLIADEGWVQLVPGKGTFVSQPERWPNDEAPPAGGN